jgi:FAD-linked sulfhydryl oxidase
MSAEVHLPWTTLGGGDRTAPKNEWGPRGWAWLHTQAINYPENPSKRDQLLMFTQYWAFIISLPCARCRLHAVQYTRNTPPNLTGSSGFQTWAWKFHNSVNHRLGKPCMSPEEYRAAYAEETAATHWRHIAG